VDVLGRRNVDSRHAVTLLRCGSRILVIGFSPQGMQVLTEMTDPVEVDFLTGLCRQSGEDTQFTQAFLDLFRRPQSTDSATERVANPSVPEPA
jgi:flagellar biogenesis protein FliO